MSSTNRSKSRDSHTSDYYVTPISAIELFLQEFEKYVPLKWNAVQIVDPCAGGNEEVRDEHGVKEVYHPMSYPSAIQNLYGKCNIQTIDIRQDSLANLKDDYLSYMFPDGEHPDIIITNPPFNQASQVISKAISDVKDYGYVITLLRLNFFGSKERQSFFEKYMPEWCFVHHIRIGFTDKKDAQGYVLFDKEGNVKRGSTDSIEYAHFVFCKGHKPQYTKLVLI